MEVHVIVVDCGGDVGVVGVLEGVDFMDEGSLA